MYAADLAYRKTAFVGASGITLLIALFDTLAGDLRRAAQAQRARDFEKRAKELKHALLVVSFLQSWLEIDSGELAAQLDSFYSKLRRRMVEAQAKQSAEMLDQQMAEVLEIRRIWQQIGSRETDSGPEILPPVKRQYPGFSSGQVERTQFSWSA